MDVEQSGIDEEALILIDHVAYVLWRANVIQDDPDKKPPEEWNLPGMPPYTWEWIAESRKERWRALARASITATLAKLLHHAPTTSPRKDA